MPGAFYLIREKHDKESVKIYGIISAVGGVIFVAMLLKSIFAGIGNINRRFIDIRLP